MPDLSFRIDGAQATPFAATPQLSVRVAIQNGTEGQRVDGIWLRCQVRIEAPRRDHSTEEADRLRDVFGAPAQWSRSLHDLLWTNLSVAVPPFTGTAAVELALPCSYDFGWTAGRYLHALAGGVVPLIFLFSGTVFHSNA